MKIMYSPIDKMKALLEMIEPSDNYAGGKVGYEAAKEFYDFVVAYTDKMQEVIYGCAHASDLVDDLLKFEEENYIDHNSD